MTTHSPDELRTPEERFASLPDFPWAPRYLEFSGEAPSGLRLHYLDEGPRDAEHTFLCLHGQPTWSFLYRKMIPVFLEAGQRVVAPDFFGFGRSDKPGDPERYTFDFHRQTIISLIAQLDLQNITLVCQDWGGLIGLTIPMDIPERFARLLVMNTGLAVGVDPGEGFQAWKAYNAANPDLPIANLMKRAVPGISPEEAAAYEAPFPDVRYKAGVQRFPEIVPVTPDMPGAALSRRAAEWFSTKWNGPTFMAVGELDPVLGPPSMKALRAVIRGCPEPMMLPNAGHFVQEAGEPVARAALEAFAAHPAR
ncbi:MAG: alpha/beta fold hydrolase [Myxococcales bacterium]|nr:alpha/beta fold hydrolase [Myxococcales bacterium]